MWTLSRTHPGDLLVLADVTIRIRYFFILTICVNMLCASLICFKIWRVHVLAKRVVDMSATKNVLEIVIESGEWIFCERQKVAHVDAIQLRCTARTCLL